MFFNALNFLSKLTIRKLFNFLKLVISYFLFRGLKKHLILGLPTSLSIEPTTSCNLFCPECQSGLRKFLRNTGMININIYSKIIDEMGSFLTYLNLYFQGESYLHPDFFSLVKYANKNHLYTATSTNAHFLNEENAKKTIESGLDRLIISIDGTTQEIYGIYRVGGKLNNVIDGTKNILKWKKELKSKKPYVIFQFMVFKQNQHQIKDVKQLGNELGVDKVVIKSAQISDFKNGNLFIPTIDKFSRYKENKNGTYTIKNKLKNHCWRLWSSSVISWDGKVVPCCFDKDAQHQMGDIRHDSFKRIWDNKIYWKFRKQVFQSRRKIKICNNCIEGMKN